MSFYLGRKWRLYAGTAYIRRKSVMKTFGTIPAGLPAVPA